MMNRVLAILIASFFTITLTAQNVDDRGYIVKVGDQCPDFNLILQDGSATNLSQLKGKVVMLQFTASWCSVCRKEMPHIESEIWQKHKDNGLILIGVDRGEPIETVKAFADKMEISYPLALDEDESIFRKFAAAKAGVTRNILIDKNGKIVFLTRLYNEDEFSALKEKIDKLMSE